MIIAAIAFPLGLMNSPIIHKINPIINAPIQRNIPMIEIKRISPIILNIKATIPTTLLSFLSSKLGVKCSSPRIKNKRNKILSENIY